jgi:hypothetical protein
MHGGPPDVCGKRISELSILIDINQRQLFWALGAIGAILRLTGRAFRRIARRLFVERFDDVRL